MRNANAKEREQIIGALAIHDAYHRALIAGTIPQTIERRADDGEYVDTDGGSYELRNGVAIISIIGPLMQYGGWWYDGHWSVQCRIVAALLDARVGSIVIEINSPGGVVAGCFDAVRAVRELARAVGKKIYAFALDGAYSAAYAWAMVANELHLPDSGGVGSVGVLGCIESWDRFNKEMGIDIAIIRSGTQKADGHPDLPLDPAAVAREQIEVDRLAVIFAGIVSESRSLTVDDVLAKQGATIHGPDAVASGFADSVTTFSAVLAMAEQASREYRMQSIAARLGLAANASESDINAEITKREVQQAAALATAQKEAAEEKAKTATIAGCAGDLAVRCGIKTVGQRDGFVSYLVAAPAAAASEIASAAPILPAQRQEPIDGTKGGEAYKTEKDPTEFPKDTDAQLALYSKNPQLYHKLRNEARKGS
jgi:ClpP class serine protease